MTCLWRKKAFIIAVGIAFIALAGLWVINSFKESMVQKSQPEIRRKPLPSNSNTDIAHTTTPTPEVAQIVGLEPLGENDRVLTLVNEMSNTLPRSDIELLYEYLKTAPNSTSTRAVKNDILNRLRNQKPPPYDLTDVMLELYRNREQDIVIRMYALQHMRPWYRIQGQKDPRIKEAFFEALDEQDTGIAGTALLALRYLSRDQEEFEPEIIANHAKSIMLNRESSMLNRITAVQVASSLGGKSGDGQVYRKIAETENDMMLRLAAIAAMGDCGDISNIGYLIDISAEQADAPLADAARVALKKLNH